MCSSDLETALREINQKLEKLKCGWLTASVAGNRNEAASENEKEKESSEKPRRLCLRKDEEKLSELSRLDGCYVITTDLPSEDICAQDVHAYYKDLAKVERAFRESKTGHLELRPIHVRKEKTTRGHVFVVMLAYLLRRELAHLSQLGGKNLVSRYSSVIFCQKSAPHPFSVAAPNSRYPLPPDPSLTPEIRGGGWDGNCRSSRSNSNFNSSLGSVCLAK